MQNLTPLYQSLCFNEVSGLACNFIKKRIGRICFHMNFAIYFWTVFLWNSSWVTTCFHEAESFRFMPSLERSTNINNTLNLDILENPSKKLQSIKSNYGSYRAIHKCFQSWLQDVQVQEIPGETFAIHLNFHTKINYVDVFLKIFVIFQNIYFLKKSWNTCEPLLL